MKLANRHRLMTLAVMATIAILAARLFWIASHTQTGWQVVAEDTRAAAFGQFFGYRIPFKYRGQKAQQQVLVEEAKRILAHQPHSAELLAGAQSLLRWDFASDFNMEFTPESVTYFAQRYPLVEQLWEEDELARARLRIELADEAAASFRGERSAWQAKAIERSSRDSPLDADETSANHWRRVFDDCRKHDPENAIYDILSAELTLIDAFYLRADKAYAGAGQIKRPTKDELEFERLAQAKDEEAVRLLKSGLRLPRFEVPDPQAAARALVGKTSLPSWEEAEVLSMNASWGSIGWPLSLLDNNLHDLTAHLESSGDGKKADDVTRMLLRLVEIQMPHPQPREIGQLYDRRARLLSELGARRDTSSEFTRAEILEADQAITENYARQQQYQSANDGWRYSFVSKRDSKGWVGFAAWACGQLTVLLLLLSAGAYLICRFIAGSATKASLIAAPTIGAWKSLTIWLLAAAVTMTVFGLAPAGIIGHRVQGWAFLVLVSAVLIFPPILAARQSRWSYGTRRLMALVAYYSVVFAVILYIDREHFNSIKHNHELRHLPPKIWMPPHGAGELDGNNVLNQYGPHTLYDVIDGGDSDPDWRPLSAQNLHTAGLQWVVYHGLGWTLALGFFATGMWLLVRARRSVERMKPEDRPVAQKRWLVGVVLRELARSAAIGSLISLAAYLLLAPARIANFEATYQDNILQVLHPDQYWAGLNEQIKKLAPDIDDVPKLPPSIAWQ